MLRILCAAYNCSPYIHRTVESVKNQTFGYFKCYIFDDCSTDGSQLYIQELIKDDLRFNLIINTKKYYPCGNHYLMMQNKEINDNDICITLDGDDWLYDDNVFKRVINYYKSNIWMSFGQFEYYFGNNRKQKGFTKKPEPFSDLRKLSWSCSHLRSFKAFLYRKIKKESLINPETNWFWDMAGDVAMLTPMIEMAGENRIMWSDDINYVYNVETDLNEHDIDLQKQGKHFKSIMKQKSYDCI